jgi:hypothetical protein
LGIHKLFEFGNAGFEDTVKSFAWESNQIAAQNLRATAAGFEQFLRRP